METGKKIALDPSKLYGFKLIGKSGNASVGSKIGGGKGGKTKETLDGVLGSKIGVKGP